MGMNVAGLIGVVMELYKPEMLKRQIGLLHKIGLPTKGPELDTASMVEVMHMDKKAEDGKIRFVLPTGLGSEPVLRYIDDKTIESVLRELK